jgi:hypothetical protein
MFRVYQALRSQYDWIHSLYCVISFLILVLLGRVWLFDNCNGLQTLSMFERNNPDQLEVGVT